MSALRTVRIRFHLVALAILCQTTAYVFADANSDWEGILELERKPPAQSFSSRTTARRLVLERLTEQEAALRAFARKYPLDDRVTDAQLRLARVLAVQSDLLPDPAKFQQSIAVLDALAIKPGQTRERMADIAFARLALQMSRLQGRDDRSRDWLTKAMRELQKKYPEDRRIPQLIVEVSTFYDSKPETKSDLLYEAQGLARDEELKLRISDDLKRLKMLGSEVPLEFVSVEGKKVSLERYRGSVVIVIFFAEWSPPSVASFTEVRAVLQKYSSAKVRAIGISLDKSPETAKALVGRMKLQMPLWCDGLSWESPLVRKLGINVLPTFWVFDRKGHLRALNARDSLDGIVRTLIREP